MAGFTKLFSSIVTSSIWCEDDATLRVWIAMLASVDSDGIVEGSIPGFANLSRVTIEQMEAALSKLSSPDVYSRTPDNEGRRIEAVPGGWKILNYAAHRERVQGKEGSRAPYMRERRRAEKEDGVTRYIPEAGVTPPSASAAESSSSEIGRGGEGERGADELDPHEFTAELVAEINAHLPEANLSPHPGLSMAISNLLEAGHPKGLMYANGCQKLAHQDLLDAAHGWIVAESRDPWHREQRERGSPFTFSRLVLDGSRLAEYAEKGRSLWAAWLTPKARAEPATAAPDPEILARHQKRDAERLAKEKAAREAAKDPLTGEAAYRAKRERWRQAR